MKNRIKSYVVVLVICVSLLFSETAVYGSTTYATTLLDEAKNILDLYYVDYLNARARQARTMEELLSAIGDPYTTYMSPEAFQEFIEEVDNKFSGIGVTVEQARDGVLILSVIKGSGAEKAGLKPGDIILEADGHILKGIDLTEAVTYIKGEEGTYVNLKIKRGELQSEVRVQRSLLELPTVEAELLEGNIAYIRIYSFGTDTDEELKKYLKELESKNPKGYIIDIRGNGGGYVDTALEIAGYFIGENVAMLASNKWGTDQYTALKDDLLIDRPVLLLVDMYSASASEILAGALQDYNKAILVGTPTYGKGSMQAFFPLSNEGLLKVTTNYIYTPTGRSINNVGLQPDINIKEEGNPYYAAILLLYGDAENKESKEEYIAIDINGKLYDIQLKQARQDEYWESYETLIKDALLKGRNIFIGTSEGWIEFDRQSDIHRYYFPDFEELPWLIDIEPDKVFSIEFSKPVNIDTLNNRIYLIDSGTGERINCEIVGTDSSGRILKATASQLLERGKKYYLVMDKGIQALDGGQLRQGVLCGVSVRN